MLKYHHERIHYLLSRHYKYTNSQKAFKILRNFKKQISDFKLVLPFDYKRALSNLENKKDVV